MRKISKDSISYFIQGIRKKRMKCPYCGGISKVYAKKYIVIDICKCLNCGLFFVNPMYEPRQGVEKFYNDFYNSDATYIPDIKELEALKETNFREGIKDYNERLSVIKRLVGGGRLLEFGSSWGYFLFQAKAYSFSPVGIEIAEKRRQFGQLNLGVDILPDIDSVDGKFDVIYSAHVLEHLMSLKNLFDKFYEKLSLGGSLIIEVPNFDPDTKGKSVYKIIGSVHPLGFSKEFFERNLARHGFSELNIAGNYEDLLKNNEESFPLKDVIVIHAKKDKEL